MAINLITTKDAVALNMAAKYGKNVPRYLADYLQKSRKRYVRKVGTILVKEMAVSKDGYFEDADWLAKHVMGGKVGIKIRVRKSRS